jgi:D-serine deaminase-like pyridoxal phosphate-dependent protein
MNDRRKEVLQMLAAGQINVEEAERLINALEKGNVTQASASDSSSESSAKAKPKYLRVLVDAVGDSEIAQKMGGSKGGPTQVNIRVPMQLLRAGVRLASLIPPQAQVHVNDALREKGLTVDLSQLKPENLEELIDGLSDMTVDVVDKNAKVAVFCE